MENMTNDFTVLEFKHAGFVHTATLPWDANMEDILQSFYGLCVASGWMPSTVLEAMHNFATESDIYNWIEPDAEGPEDDD
jgi:hypothetical protein